MINLKVAIPLAAALAAALAVPSGLAGGDAHNVDVFNFGYTDEESGTPVVSVAAGTVVRFTWTSGVHTVTSGAAGEHVAEVGDLDSPVLTVGATWDYAADTPGVFPFTCKLHPTMNGVLVVQ